MFDLRDRGFDSPFEQLVGSLISARTRDETTLAVCLRLFAVARTPEAFVALGETRLAELLHGASFPEPKARDLIAIARRIVDEFGGEVPDTFEALTSFRGVGPKIANLTLAVGFDRPALAIDIHVHRVTNRWGYVATSIAREDPRGAGRDPPEAILDRDQRAARPFRQGDLHGRRAEVLDVSAALDVPPGGRHVAPLRVSPRTIAGAGGRRSGRSAG